MSAEDTVTELPAAAGDGAGHEPIDDPKDIDVADIVQDRAAADTPSDEKASGIGMTKEFVTWDGPDDPENPRNMSKAHKWLIVVLCGLMTFTVTFSSSVFSTAVPVTAAEFHVSGEVTLLGLSLFVLGFATGPLLWGPLSEAYGRTRPLFTGMVIFCIFQIPVAVAHNLETVLISRFIAGMGGVSPISICSGIFGDLLEPVQRGTALAAFICAVFAGPVAGPVVGSFTTASHLGWRWTAWLAFIAGVVSTIACFIALPETYEPYLLRRKAERLRRKTKDTTLRAKSEDATLTLSILARKNLAKPMVMIVKEPILFIVTIYSKHFQYSLTPRH